MGPPENSTRHPENQGAGRRKRPALRRRGALRARWCLLKGCKQRFHPRQARQRYCSQRCREAARQWSQWKAQQRYREKAAGKRKRNGQSVRYRERVRSRKPAETEAVNQAARVITTEHFFRSFLRPAGLLRRIRGGAAKSLTTLLLPRLPAGAGARSGTGAALEEGTRFNLEILICQRRWPYIQPVGCNWSFTSWSGGGSTCGCGIRRGSGGCWRRWPRAASKRPSWWWRPKARRTATWSSTAISGSWHWSNWGGTRWKRWYGR